MIKLVRCVGLALLLMAGTAGAATLTAEQKPVMSFIQKMYSYSADMFEGRIFDGKDNPQRQCLLLRDFFSSSLLTPEDSRWHGCDPRWPLKVLHLWPVKLLHPGPRKLMC